MTSRQSRWRHDNRQVRVNIDATLVAIFRIDCCFLNLVATGELCCLLTALVEHWKPCMHLWIKLIFFVVVHYAPAMKWTGHIVLPLSALLSFPHYLIIQFLIHNLSYKCTYSTQIWYIGIRTFMIIQSFPLLFPWKLDWLSGLALGLQSKGFGIWTLHGSHHLDFRDLAFPASKSRYDWNIAEAK